MSVLNGERLNDSVLNGERLNASVLNGERHNASILTIKMLVPCYSLVKLTHFMSVYAYSCVYIIA